MSTHNVCFEQKYENYRFFFFVFFFFLFFFFNLNIYPFWGCKMFNIPMYLDRRVFVMVCFRSASEAAQSKKSLCFSW